MFILYGLRRTGKTTLIRQTILNMTPEQLYDRNEPIDIMQNIDEDTVTEFVKTMLDILDEEEQMVEVDDTHAYQIKEYLSLLDLIMEVDLLHFPVKLQFAVGEFDMVIYDRGTLTCEIYEIKYSREVVAGQYRHLINAEKCAETEHRFGRVTGRYVIYCGDAVESDGVQYLNVEQYLKSLV